MLGKSVQRTVQEMLAELSIDPYAPIWVIQKALAEHKERPEHSQARQEIEAMV